MRAPGAPCVWAYVPGAATQATILAAIRQGHVSLSESQEGPLLQLSAGRGSEVISGDGIARPANGRLQVRVRCQNGAGSRLIMLDQNGPIGERTLTDADGTITEELPVNASLYVRAELRNEYDELKALANPIYLE